MAQFSHGPVRNDQHCGWKGCPISVTCRVLSDQGDPQFWCCHLHAAEAITGKPIMMPTPSELYLQMLALSA